MSAIGLGELPAWRVKGKEKTDSRSSNVWDDKGLVEERAHGAMTTEDLKVISGVSFNEVVTRHVHKLV